ncbi:hypothetical protein K2X33_06180, partial [bacterium]|nr:hypothetical protein [bacterium]
NARKQPTYWKTLVGALSDPAYLPRLQAVFALHDRKFPKPEDWEAAIAGCLQDKNANVRTACEGLRR